MTAASVPDDFARLLAEHQPFVTPDYKLSELICTGCDWRGPRGSHDAHLADVLAAHVAPLLADLRADNNKLRDDLTAAVAWQKRGLAAEAKVEHVEALATELESADRPLMSYNDVVARIHAALRGDDAATDTDDPHDEGRPVQGCAVCATYRGENRACPHHRKAQRSPEWQAAQLDPRVTIRTIEHDGGGLEITAADNYYLDEEYVTVNGRHVLRLWVRPSDEETTS